MPPVGVELDFWRPARPVPYNQAIAGYVVLMGYSIKETTGTATAELDVYDGASTGGGLTIPLTLSAGQSAEDWFGPQGLEMAGGIFVNVASGSVSGSLWIADRLGSNR